MWLLAFGQVQGPFVANADQTTQEAKGYDGDDSEAILLPDRESEEHEGLENAEKCNPPQWTPSPGMDVGSVTLAFDLDTADGVGRKGFGVTRNTCQAVVKSYGGRVYKYTRT